MLRSNDFSILYLCFIISFTSEITSKSFYSSSKCESKKYSYNFPQDSGLPCYCDRFTPISIITSQTKPVRVPEMKIDFTKDAEFVTNNTGERVKSTLIRGNITLTGGCVLDKVYNFFQSIYHVDGVPQFTRATDFIDGKGFPINHEVVWTKDGLTVDEAFTQPDGFLTVSIGVKVEGNKDNKKLESYASVLKKVRQYNATTTSSAYDVLAFLLDTLPNNCLYCYPGSRNDPDTGTKLPVAIHIDMSMKITPIISYRQYKEVYLKVLNPVNQTLLNPVECYEQGNRTVVEICDPIRINYGGRHQNWAQYSRLKQDHEPLPDKCNFSENF